MLCPNTAFEWTDELEEACKQRDRIIDSKVVSSEQLADMYLMYKDHKEGRASRPVVTACNSNTRGMSNNVSDLLESVNKANLHCKKKSGKDPVRLRVALIFS